ncbi:MAG TPA: circularly permuted type 2 ATP-grasp protein [Acetobacteraceae bacterium]|jgi:uncharacterized circularly permuted ATP-grasp superfamily protein/uncharacterized alpha-E superfamily protein
MVDGRGGLRPHWRTLLGAFSALGADGLAARARRLDRAFEEEGVTSLLPGVSTGAQRWRCDPIPLPIPEGEFAEIETGLAQRARLLEAVLQDIYGRQELLADGVLPPALVFANPCFLRAGCRRSEDAAPMMQFYAADLVRGPDGAWRVLADRTAGAGGVGYARENRRLLAQVIPEAFRPMQVRQLRPFFDVWQDALHRLAPPGRRNPIVALLTQGIADPQWFEHMFLSRELSCALVEGGDLTVRGGEVFLKTLRGLQQVDVLLRRMDGRMLDPLELETRSLQGVSGLLNAARHGTVRIANDAGSGALEAPAFAAFLPALCMRLLGEGLAMASVPTMWLGEAQARALVQQDPGRWLIRPAVDGKAHALAPMLMEPAIRQALLGRIEERPREWAASAGIPPSVVPCLGESGMVPKSLVLRVFMVFDGTRWRAMQGGLARVLDSPDQLAGGLPKGGTSKDVWVLTEDRADIVGPAALAIPTLQLRRTSGDLPSRVADNLFWLGRYVERLEHRARLVRAVTGRLSRGAAIMPRELAELNVLSRCLTEAAVIDNEDAGIGAIATLTDALFASTRDTGAIGANFASVARLTERVRDRLTGDMYATFTQTLRAARECVSDIGHSLDGLASGMIAIMRFSAAVAGVAAENMVRGGGWLFLDLGRRIERAQAVASEVAFALDMPAPRIEAGLRLVLELCDSAITYRSRYMNVLQPAPVLDLVLADQGNPRGLAFQLARMRTRLGELGDEGSPRDMLAGFAAGLLAEVEALVDKVLAAENQSVAAAAIPPSLHAVSDGIASLSDRITRRYFALLPAVQAVGMSGQMADLRGAA